MTDRSGRDVRTSRRPPGERGLRSLFEVSSAAGLGFEQGASLGDAGETDLAGLLVEAQLGRQAAGAGTAGGPANRGNGDQLELLGGGGGEVVDAHVDIIAKGCVIVSAAP